MTATAGAACSTSTAEPAPRDSASMASAPVPANRSSTRAPSTRVPQHPEQRLPDPVTGRPRVPPRDGPQPAAPQPPPDNPHGTHLN